VFTKHITFYLPFQILKGLSPIRGRPGDTLAPLNFRQLNDELVEKHSCKISETDVISSALYPKVTDDFIKFRNEFGPVDLLNTRIFLEGPKVGEEFEVSLLLINLLNIF
jgi:pyruvate carboxylase, mitochondrial